VAALALAAPLALGACSADHSAKASGSDADAVSVAPASGDKPVDPSKRLVVTAAHGDLADVTVTADDGSRVTGSLSADDRTWRATELLGAGRRYTVRVITDGGSDGFSTTVRSFRTTAASHLLTAQLSPSDGDVYGVGEPITVALSEPVHDPAARAQVERGLTVQSSPSVTGAWYWVDDKTLHFRPQTYWPANATISASFDLHGQRIGGPTSTLYAGAPSHIAFRTGDSLIAVTDVASDEMKVYRDGRLIRTVPVTTGKAGFRTRNGIKVVLEKAPVVFMNSSTVGIAAGSSNAYAMNVYWDTRVTWSGEYVHAAPWSEGSQGVANVSHGCTGLSVANAEWFYHTVRRGDVVQVVHGLGKQMEDFGNGFGDWNVGWKQWLTGSALHRTVRTSPHVQTGGGSAAAEQTSLTTGYLKPQA